MIEKGKKPNTDVLGKLKNGQFMEGFLWLCGLWTHMVTMRVWVWSQWVQDPVLPWAVVGFRHGLYSTLLWLWCRLAAAPLIQPIAWELPYTTSVTLERKKKKKKPLHDLMSLCFFFMVIPSFYCQPDDFTEHHLHYFSIFFFHSLAPTDLAPRAWSGLNCHSPHVSKYHHQCRKVYSLKK